MCGPFKNPQAILRLLEIIFSTLALAPLLFRGPMLNPWGVWCMFVWFLCMVLSLVLLVMEALLLHILLRPILPDWDDLCCGLAIICAAITVSAAAAFGAVFLCPQCITDILVFVFALVDAVLFLADAVMRKMKCPSGYLSGLRGLLRLSEAFAGCMAVTAAVDFLKHLHFSAPPFGMIVCVVVLAVCVLVAVIIVLLHLLKLLKCLLSCGLGLLEFAFNIAALLAHVLVAVLWMALGFTRRLHVCDSCMRPDFIAVIVATCVNLVLYLVDLILSVKSR